MERTSHCGQHDAQADAELHNKVSEQEPVSSPVSRASPWLLFPILPLTTTVATATTRPILLP